MNFLSFCFSKKNILLYCLKDIFSRLTGFFFSHYIEDITCSFFSLQSFWQEVCCKLHSSRIIFFPLLSRFFSFSLHFNSLNMMSLKFFLKLAFLFYMWFDVFYHFWKILSHFLFKYYFWHKLSLFWDSNYTYVRPVDVILSHSSYILCSAFFLFFFFSHFVFL